MGTLFSDDLDCVLASTREMWHELRGGRLFVTGATGFFGSWILETFAWANARLGLRARATILTRDLRGFRAKLPHLAADSAIEVVADDVRNFAFPPGQFSHVIHAATESNFQLNNECPGLMFDTVVQGTRRCLEFAAAAGTKKFLLTSSGAVYGEQPPHMTHMDESFGGGPQPLDPGSAYAEGKRAAELFCVLQAGASGLEAKIARCFAFLGPRMKLDAHFAIGNFIRDQLRGGPITVSGDGTPFRSYMYASDLMTWLWTILFRGESCRAYNVGSEQAISIADLAREVANTTTPPCAVEVRGTPTGAPPQRYVPSTARAREELGLRCQVPLRDAIQRTRTWFQAQSTAAAAGKASL
jgi:dTDP-glucose 4,6-dehydratase